MSQQISLPGIEKATIIERDQHSISRKQISPNALKVLNKLDGAGFCAYLVGGSVRDMLLGMKPKDFDIATNATPEELKNLFRNAQIIGRRFMIVHLRFGREIIEVTTFRAHHDAQNQIADDVSRRQIRGLDSAHSSAGMILRDNVYGNIDEDALRRDLQEPSVRTLIRALSAEDARGNESAGGKCTATSRFSSTLHYVHVRCRREHARENA